MDWIVDLENQEVRHTEIAFLMTFSGVPGTQSFDGKPVFPPGLDSLDQVRLVRESYEIYAAAYLSSHGQPPKEFGERAAKPTVTVKHRKSRRIQPDTNT